MISSTSCWKVQLFIAAAVAFVTPTDHVGAFMSSTHHPSRIKNPMKNVALFLDSSKYNLQNDDLISKNVHVDNEVSAAPAGVDRNESDIIRILRANPHQSKQPIEKASDVLNLLSNHSQPLSLEEVVHNVSPNIAAAALRRLVSPPFLPLTFATTKQYSQYLYKNQWSNLRNNIDDEERLLYGQLVHHLLAKLRTVIDEQIQIMMLEEESPTRSSIKSQSPQLLPRKDTWHHPPSSSTDSNVLNWYALADLLSSLSVVCNIPQRRTSVTTLRNGYHEAILNVKEDNNGAVTSLFRSVIQYVAWDNKVMSSFIRCIGSRRIIRDLLHPLVIAANQQRMREVASWDDINFVHSYDDDDESAVFDDNLHNLMTVASAYLGSPSSLAKVTAADLSTALWSLTQIYPSQSHELHSYRPFINACLRRLRKRSVISSARGSELALAIRSVERLLGLLGREDDESRTQPFEGILSLPLQLPGEESAVDSNFTGTLLSPDITDEVLPTNTQNDGSVSDNLSAEALTMFHTLVNELLYQGDGKQMKLRSLSLRQIADVLQTANILNVSRDDLQPATIEVLDYLVSDPLFVTSQTHSCRDISRILDSLQRLRVGSGIYNLDLESRCVQSLGERFLEIVTMQRSRGKGKCDPKTLTAIVRSGVMMFSNYNVTNALLEAASILILDDTIAVDISDSSDDFTFVDSGVTAPFLLQCNDSQLSWFLWAFAVARQYDNDVFVALTNQVLDSISDDSVGASSASRIMWSTSVLMSLDGAGDALRCNDLFFQLSPILLSSQLSPIDLSCAMYAIAKTNYVLDRGVFDFLAEELSSDESLERSNTRLISQAVWACGKMTEFEDPVISSTSGEIQELQERGDNQPPYINNVHKLLTFLIKNKEQMTPKHVAETIWAAFGRMYISDQSYLEEFGNIAKNIAHRCNAREIANIVWAFSKVDHDNPELITFLVRVVVDELSDQCTSQEAANMIYALGRLNIRDELLFSELSSIIEKNIQSATSQAIANALWGHDMVDLAPPPDLLSFWARSLLSLDTADLIE
jgi:hypothetical protein